MKRTFTYNGKRYYIYGNTEEEIKRKMAERRLSLEQGEPKELPLKDWIKTCIEIYKPNFKNDTEYAKTYQYRMDSCITRVIGDMDIKSIMPIHCQQCLNLQSGKSNYQIQQTKQMLNFIFERAVDNDLISRNPARNLVLPKGTKSQRRALTEEERKIFLELTENNERYWIFYLMYHIGCRPNEARELKTEDVETLKDGTHLIHIKGTKTVKSDRYVPITEELYQKIKNRLKDEFLAPNKIGNKQSDKTMMLSFNSLKDDLKQYLNTVDDLVPYCLRHDFATRMSQRLNITEVQYLLGHSNITMTANVYTHISKELLGDTAQRMQHP